MAHIGFVGVGRMGGHMAARLMDIGHELTICDPNPAATATLVARGAILASSPSTVASATETVMISLPTPDVVDAVALGESGLSSGNRVRTVIDLSTTGPRVAAAVASGLDKRGIEFIDSPVSGGIAGAKAGTLAVMASGNLERIEQVRPLLERFGKLYIIGDSPGMAQMMKVINNLMSVTSLAIASEAMVLGAKAGLNADMMIEVINAGSGRTTATTDKIPKHVLPRTFDFGFAVGLSCKDTKLCLEEGEALGVPMIVGNAVRQLLTMTKAGQGADADMTAIVKEIERWAGVEVRGAAAA